MSAPANNPVHAAVRWVVGMLVRLFFPVVRLSRGERIPTSGPLLFVATHYNGLLDPIVLRLATHQPARFLAKSTLFGNPLGKLAMSAFGAIPVYRTRDGGDAGRAEANERTFALCRAALARGEPLALFPEGTSHSDPQLKPFKTGAARIALSAEAEHDFALGLRIVPAAIVYGAKTVFRSSALVALGEPIVVKDYQDAYMQDAHEAARSLTAAMRVGLEAEALTADTRELLEGITEVSAYAASSAEDAHDVAKRHVHAKAMLRGYRELAARDPATLEAIVAEARTYVATLRELGIEDPWGVEVGRVRTAAVLREVLILMALALPALVGALLSWLPYRLIGVLARRAEEDVQGTVKLTLGMFLLPLWWALEILAAAFWLGWSGDGGVMDPKAFVLALLALPTGYAALRFEERVCRTRASLTYAWLRRGRPGVARALVAQRRALATRVEGALRAASLV